MPNNEAREGTAKRADAELEADIRETIAYLHTKFFNAFADREAVREAQRFIGDVLNSWDRVRTTRAVWVEALAAQIPNAAYCEQCGKTQMLVDEQMRQDDLNPYPWRDLTCSVCKLILKSVSRIPAEFALNGAASNAKRVEELEAICRKQGHLYFNGQHTGRRLLWTDAGWELEPHRSDKSDFTFDTVLEAFASVNKQGEPKTALRDSDERAEGTNA